VRCGHCGIRFFTHPRNSGRLDLRCEFGCRQHHRRQQANARSRKYYQRPEGRRNKKLLNGKRSRSVSDVKSTSADEVDATPSSTGQPALKALSGATKASSCSCADSTSAFPPQGVPKRAAPSAGATLSWEGVLLDERALVNSPALPYALMVASVLERRTISRDELIAALRASMRQRSIGGQPRREYVLRYLNQHPP